MENYIKRGGDYIKNNKKKLCWETKNIPKLQRTNIRKIGIIEDSHIGRLNKRHFNEKINYNVYLMFFGVQT